MPQLKNFEKKEQIYLPSTKDEPNTEDRAWVVMDVSPVKTGDVAIYDDGMKRGEYQVMVVANRIKEWNYTDASGEPVPINFDTVTQLDTDDFKYLQTLIESEPATLSTDEKKSSSDTSSPQGTITVQEL